MSQRAGGRRAVSSRAGGYVIALDVGGTFTDVALVHEASGRLWVTKTPTTPHDPADGFVAGIDKALFRFHVGRPLLASVVAALPGSAARRRPLVWDRALEPVPNPTKVRRSLAELQRVLPSLPSLGNAKAWAGYIDAAPDLVPVLGEVPQLGGFVLATGFSGHGFAMGPIAGRLVAELIVDGKTSLDIAGFRFSRFAEGAVGKPRNVL